MTTRWITVPGVLTQGHGVASGRSASRYAEGTIRAQTPHFLARGVDLSSYFPGTLNVDIAPRRLTLVRPLHTLHGVTWWPGVTETFSFSPCRVVVAGQVWDGLVYHPHPETKPEHFQSPTIVEVLAPFIEDARAGMAVELHLDAGEVTLT